MSRVQIALTLPTRVVPVRDDDISSGVARPKHVVLGSVRHTVQSLDLATALRHMAPA
jgi:dTDP-4-dehydrorhamnose reductase